MLRALIARLGLVAFRVHVALALLAPALWLAGCAALPGTTPGTTPGSAGPTPDCSAWFARLDALTDAAGVRDAEADRIEGFAGLRVSREAAARGSDEGVAEFDRWWRRLAALEDEGRAVELANLPAEARAALDGSAAIGGAGRADGAVPARGVDAADPGPNTVRIGPFALSPSTSSGQALSKGLRGFRQAQPERAVHKANSIDPSPAARAADPLAISRACTQAWAAAFAREPALRDALRERARVPDRYSFAARALGLYPLVRWPFFAGVTNWESGHRAAMERWAAAPPAVRRYGPADDRHSGAQYPGPAGPEGMAGPELTASPAAGLDAGALLARHAPWIDIEHGGAAPAADRFGAVGWRLAGDSHGGANRLVVEVNTQAPTVYTRLAATRVAGRWLPQLVYTLWFPERPSQGAFDLLAGRLDGVMLRLTLDDSGSRVLMLDTIHACGCWHLFFPAADVALRPGAPAGREWAFVAQRLPALAAGERLLVRLSAGEHQVMAVVAAGAASGTARAGNGVAEAGPTAGGAGAGRTADARSATAAAGATPYRLLPEQALRTLPLPQPASAGAGPRLLPPTRPPARAGTRSLYSPDGLVAGSERAERWLFWPMGISSAGAMRQWGHHATAFVGRRHFDDADLLDARFVFP